MLSHNLINSPIWQICPPFHPWAVIHNYKADYTNHSVEYSAYCHHYPCLYSQPPLTILHILLVILIDHLSDGS